jgi:predicted TIM-barrel fold metal-dependent hydrolase
VIIDVHVHPVFQEISDRPEMARTIQQLELTSKRYFYRSQNIQSLNGFQDEMKNAGIDKVVIQMPGEKGVPARPANEQVSMLLRMLPDKFIGFAGFDPNQGEEAVADIEHAVKELGFKGLKTVSSLLELNINDKALYPCYAKAQELGVPIMIHTGASSLVMGYRVKYVQPLMVDDVAFDFPDLKIICAHMGGHDYMDVHSILVRHPNVYADLCFWPLNPRYKDLIPWRLLEETVPDKILLGSDYPCGQTPKEAVETVRALPISEDFKLKILGENAARLLGLQQGVNVRRAR